jgi:hypothetical protein
MFRPKGRVSREGRFDVFFVTILAIVAAILWIALPVMATAKTIHVVAHKKGGGTPNTFSITYDPDEMAHGTDNTVSGTKDDVPLKGISYPGLPFHVNTDIRALDNRGPFLVIGDSTCVCYPYGGGLRCIGTPCP